MRLDRLNEIEHYIFQHGNVSLENLSERFHVSISTIRRDIAELLKTGSIQKVYGGVSSTTPSKMIPLKLRETEQLDAKSHIAELASKKIQDNSAVFLDTGTTISALIPYLLDKQNLTIVTNSLRVIDQVAQTHLNLFAVGGFYNSEISGFVGITVQENLSNLSFSQAFISVTGVSLENGLTVNGYFEDPIKRQVLKRCGKNTILLVDSTKFEQSALFSFGGLQDIGCVITEKAPPEKYLEKLQEWNVEVIY